MKRKILLLSSILLLSTFCNAQTDAQKIDEVKHSRFAQYEYAKYSNGDYITLNLSKDSVYFYSQITMLKDQHYYYIFSPLYKRNIDSIQYKITSFDSTTLNTNRLDTDRSIRSDTSNGGSFNIVYTDFFKRKTDTLCSKYGLSVSSGWISNKSDIDGFHLTQGTYNRHRIHKHKFNYKLVPKPKIIKIKVIMLACDTSQADNHNVYWIRGYILYKKYQDGSLENTGIFLYGNKKKIPSKIIIWKNKELEDISKYDN
jgi:hypothetical protein